MEIDVELYEDDKKVVERLMIALKEKTARKSDIADVLEMAGRNNRSFTHSQFDDLLRVASVTITGTVPLNTAIDGNEYYIKRLKSAFNIKDN